MTAAAPAPAYPRASAAWYVVGVLTAGWVLAYLDRQIIGILIESLRRDLGVSDTQVSLVQGLAFSLFFVLAGLPIGRLVDRASRRNILIFGVLAWSLMTMACGLAQSFGQLFAARIGVGIGEACLAPATMSIVADMIRPGRRGIAMSCLFAGSSIGSAASILLGGLVLQALGPAGTFTLPLLGVLKAWQLVFILIGAPGLLLALLLMTFPEPVRREKAQARPGAGAFLAFVRRHPAAVIFTYLAYTANFIIGYAVASWVAVILLRVHHVPPAQVGWTVGAVLLFVGSAGAALSGLLGDAFTRRWPDQGRLAVIQIALPLQLLVMLAWSLADSAAISTLAFALSGPLFGGMITASAYPALNQMAPNELRGQVVAVFLLVTTLTGLGLAPTAVAMMTDLVFGDPQMVRHSVIWVCAPAAAIGLVFAFLARKPYGRAVAETRTLIAQEP